MALSLDACFAQNQGKALLVPGGGAGNEGQCVQWADTVLHDVYGLPYVYANAIDWWPLPQSLAGKFVQVTDGSIKKGDFVIFNQKVGSVYGHIDVAMNDGSVNGFTGADSNWGGNKTVHLVNHSGQAGYIIGALRPKGADMSDIADHDFVADACVGMMNVQPETNQVYMNNIGLPKSQVLKNILNYQQSVNLRLDAEAYRAGQKAAVNKQAVIDYINKNLG